MRLPTVLGLSLALLGACAAPATPDTALPGQSADASSCAARGGEIRRVGRAQIEQCVIRYADAGKSCTDGDQCQGDCRIEGNLGTPSGSAATGQCSASSSPFGCYTRVEDGKAEATLCVD